MAAVGSTPISLYHSSTPTQVPSAGNLIYGELAINIYDGKLYFKDSSNVVQLIASKGAATIGGSNTQVQYNNAGSLAGSSNLTFDGTNLSVGGNVTAAAIIPSGSSVPTNGTFLPATNSIGFSTNSAERVRVDAQGNLTLKTGSIQEVKRALSSSTIDLSTGNYFSITISGTTTFSVTNVPSNNTAMCFVLDITNGGSATVNWWSGVTWSLGVAPTLTASGRDTLAFFTYDGGTTWNGFVLGKAMS